MKKHYRVNWDRVWVIILAIVIAVILNRNYRLTTSREWRGDVNAYTTKLSIERK